MSRKEEANRHYGVGHGFARPSAGKTASPGDRTRRGGRTTLHEYAVASANRMSCRK